MNNVKYLTPNNNRNKFMFPNPITKLIMNGNGTRCCVDTEGQTMPLRDFISFASFFLMTDLL